MQLRIYYLRYQMFAFFILNDILAHYSFGVHVILYLQIVKKV